MANLIIRLQVDPKTQKKNVIISYTSESDALPQEHEEAHRALVDKLIAGGALKASEVGEIVLERESDSGVRQEQPAQEPPRAEGLKQKG